MDLLYNKEPICPHCSHTYSIDENESYHVYNDDDLHEVTCPNCENEFWIKTSTSHSFSSAKQLEDL